MSERVLGRFWRDWSAADSRYSLSVVIYEGRVEWEMEVEDEVHGKWSRKLTQGISQYLREGRPAFATRLDPRDQRAVDRLTRRALADQKRARPVPDGRWDWEDDTHRHGVNLENGELLWWSTLKGSHQGGGGHTQSVNHYMLRGPWLSDVPAPVRSTLDAMLVLRPPPALVLWPSVRERPDDDEPRLVFADALQEAGDPRGEFIRLQCLEARGVATDAMRRRARHLEATHGPDWVAALMLLAAPEWRPEWTPTFRRGFVEVLTLPAGHFVEVGEHLWDAAPLLQTVKLRGNHTGVSRSPALEEAERQGATVVPDPSTG